MRSELVKVLKHVQPGDRVAEEVMQLNRQLAKSARETGITFTLADLDQQLMALLHNLEDSDSYLLGESSLPIIRKKQWLHAQWFAIQKPAKGEEL